jgi:uncharacterized protein YcbK (DUF882 family)
MALLVAVMLWAGSVWAAPMERFFIMGDGQLALVNAHTDARVDARYRRTDGTYDEAALARIREVFGGQASLRLIEVLSHVQKVSGVQPLTVMSGYRSPEYNEDLRSKGVRAAGGSLHTEGLAADVAFPRKMLKPLWMKVRGLECCGAGYYAKNGFLHIDVGRPRFWEPATSRVEENLSAGNARLFARTEYDRYGRGEEIVLSVHAMTVPPVRLVSAARFISGDQNAFPMTLGGAAEGDGCLEILPTTTAIRAYGTPPRARGLLLLSTCEPRVEKTPATLETNPIDIR